jgi:hypothetical protein
VPFGVCEGCGKADVVVRYLVMGKELPTLLWPKNEHEWVTTCHKAIILSDKKVCDECADRVLEKHAPKREVIAVDGKTKVIWTPTSKYAYMCHSKFMTVKRVIEGLEPSQGKWISTAKYSKFC